MILRRLPDSRFSEVLPNWKGATVALLGGGPSLTQAQVDIVRESACRPAVLAINNSYLLAPFADICYFSDTNWWKEHKDRREFIDFSGEKCSIENGGGFGNVDEPIHLLRNCNHPLHGWGLSSDPQKLVTGSHGGFQALNLAILAGAAKIILLGYDGKPGDKSHWHGGHKQPTPQSAYQLYVQSFVAAQNEIKASGARVLNCSPGSAIDTFEKVSLAEALRL